MKTYAVTYFLPHPQSGYYLLSVRSELEAVNKNDAADTIIARHVDNRGNSPRIQTIVECDPQRPLAHTV